MGAFAQVCSAVRARAQSIWTKARAVGPVGAGPAGGGAGFQRSAAPRCGVEASRNSVCSCTPSRRLAKRCNCSNCLGRCGRLVALRASMAMATRWPWWACCRRTNAGEQLGRQVVHAVVARVFQRFEGDGFARAGQAGDQYNFQGHSAAFAAMAAGAACAWVCGTWASISRAWAKVVAEMVLPAQHAGDFLLALLGIGGQHLAGGAGFAPLFAHHAMLVGTGGHLRQVRRRPAPGGWHPGAA